MLPLAAFKYIANKIIVNPIKIPIGVKIDFFNPLLNPTLAELQCSFFFLSLIKTEQATILLIV